MLARVICYFSVVYIITPLCAIQTLMWIVVCVISHEAQESAAVCVFGRGGSVLDGRTIDKTQNIYNVWQAEIHQPVQSKELIAVDIFKAASLSIDSYTYYSDATHRKQHQGVTLVHSATV